MHVVLNSDYMYVKFYLFKAYMYMYVFSKKYYMMENRAADILCGSLVPRQLPVFNIKCRNWEWPTNNITCVHMALQQYSFSVSAVYAMFMYAVTVGDIITCVFVGIIWLEVKTRMELLPQAQH